MEQQINPYESGQAVQQGYADPSVSLPVTPVALAALVGTKFWVMLVGGGIILMVVLQLLSFFFAGFTARNFGVGEGGFPVLIMAMVLGIVVVYLIMGVRLLQYGKAIKRLSISSDGRDLERAMEVQSKFWRLLGIVFIVTIALYLFIVIGAMILFSSRF